MMRDHLSNEEVCLLTSEAFRPLMTPEQFFSGLSKLIETLQKSGHGSVYLTQKRSDHCPSP